MECPYCKKVFETKYSLKNHIKTARYCIKQRGEDIGKNDFICLKCPKTFTSKRWLLSHQEKCGESIVSFKETNKLLQIKIKNLQETLNKNTLDYEEKVKTYENKYEKKILNLQDKLENIAIKAVEKTTLDENKYDIGWLEEIMSPEKLDTPYNKLKEENKDFKSQIKYLINKCVKKQPRIQYKEKYVIYVLTTDLMKKERRYILGKAKDLTSRLSTYNKSDEHEVVYYQSCGNQETMSCVENMVFEYLKKYREKANRERFILPETEEIKLFITAIKKSVDFFNNI